MAAMTLLVEHLFEHPGHRGCVATWIYQAFWRGRPGYGPATFEALLAEAKDADTVPLSLLALADGRPAGTVNLIENDDSRRRHLRPWLAALYVAPECRGAGVGSALVHAVSDHAARLGLSALYLGTDIPAFYRRFDAVVVEREGDHHVMRMPVPIAIGSTASRP